MGADPLVATEPLFDGTLRDCVLLLRLFLFERFLFLFFFHLLILQRSEVEDNRTIILIYCLSLNKKIEQKMTDQFWFIQLCFFAGRLFFLSFFLSFFFCWILFWNGGLLLNKRIDRCRFKDLVRLLWLFLFLARSFAFSFFLSLSFSFRGFRNLKQ